MTTLESTRALPSWAARALRIALLAALTAIGAKVTVDLPFTPVPITLQVLFVVAAGLALGPWEGAGSQVAYLATLLAGLPLDSRGVGAAALAGPTAGYLWFFPVAAAVAGLGAGAIGSEGRLKLLRRIIAGLAAVAVIYAGGVTWLAQVTGESWGAAWALGGAPFVVVDAGKVLLAASGVSVVEEVMGRFAAGRG